jgi:hypothetical protein
VIRYLRRVPIERVNLIEACVAPEERRIVWSEARPGAERADSARKVFQRDYSLQLAVLNADPTERRIRAECLKVYVLTIARP